MLNKIFLIGRLGADIEAKATQSGHTMGVFSLATDEKVKNKLGNYEKKTTWVNCIAFGSQAQALIDYTSKGSLIHIEGKLAVDKYVDKEGHDRLAYKVIVNQVKLLGGDKKAPSEPLTRSHAAPSLDDDEIPF